MRQAINAKTAKRCAFCKHWYDPSNSCIAPKAPKVNLWEYDSSARNICIQRNKKMLACTTACNKYECKVTVF